MTDTLNGVKAKAMSTTLGETGSVNGLEKKYWEHILAGGGSGGGSDPDLAAKVNANTASITSLTTEVGTKISQQDADSRYLSATGDSAHDGDLFVQGDMGAQTLTVDAPGEVGLLIGATSSTSGAFQPLDNQGQHIAGSNLEFNYTTKKWSANGGELATTNGPTFIADTIVRGELAADSVAVQPDNSYGLILRGDGNNSFIVPTDKLGKVKGNVIHFNHTEGKWAANGGELIPDAPKDGKVYGRSNGAWVEITTTASRITPAPVPTAWDSSQAAVTGQFAADETELTGVSGDVNGGKLTVTKTSDVGEYLYLIVKTEDAQHVRGVRLDGGLSAQWRSRPQEIDGTTYEVFVSPYKITKSPIDVEVVWG